MRQKGLIGVPYTSMAKPGGIADAIRVLRGRGLARRLGEAGVEDWGDLDLPRPDGVRGPSGLLNEIALVRLVEATSAVVRTVDQRGIVPLLVGGDCPVILGALAGLGPDTGLVMVDGHEDAWPPEISPTGEASDSEVAIALGRVKTPLPVALKQQLPLVDPAHLALLGPRDSAEIAEGGATSIAREVAFFRDGDALAREGARALTAAVEAVGTNRFWLHVDFDVLSTAEFPAVDYRQEGGISMSTLSSIAARALGDVRCAGASFVIYNPDLDPDRACAERLVHFLAVVIARVNSRRRVVEAGQARYGSDPDDST